MSLVLPIAALRVLLSSEPAPASELPADAKAQPGEVLDATGAEPIAKDPDVVLPPVAAELQPSDALPPADPELAPVEDEAGAEASGEPPQAVVASEVPADPDPAAWKTPLPAPPDPVPVEQLVAGPWRGRGWVTVHLDLVVPVGGSPPARGSLVTGGGGGWAGARLLPFVGLYGGVTTFLHDVETRTEFDEVEQDTIDTSSFGRLTLFDIGVLRLWLPTKRRIQPYADVGGFVGIYRPPFREPRGVAGGGRFGAGVDFWVGPSFSLGLSIDERLIVIEKRVGHSLQLGFGATLHW